MAEAASESNHLAVCAIDFGTSFTGIAYSFSTDYNSPRILASCTNRSYGEKSPTVVLLTEKKAFWKFGYEAQEKYSQICDNKKEAEYFYFDCFKMNLYEEKKLTADVQISDVKGRKFPALDIFAMVIEHLVSYVENISKRQTAGLEKDDILWVLTVPAIWSDSARNFMRKAAEKAGIPSEHLMLCLEPEAASVYCISQKQNKTASHNGIIELKPIPEGQKYMVVDLGGGTADISVHEIVPGRNLREIKRSDGGAFGGNLIDDAFFRLLDDIFGVNVMTLIKETNYGEIMALKKNFLPKKHLFEPVTPGESETYNIELPVDVLKEAIKELEFTCSIDEKMNKAEIMYEGKVKFLNNKKIILDSSIMEDFFNEAIKSIVEILSDLRKDKEVGTINMAMLVGGLSSSPYIQNEIKKRIPGLRIFVPTDTSLAVLKGAVLMGHKPKTITEKIARYSYGLTVLREFIEGEHPEKYRTFKDGKCMCSNIFKKLVEKGTIYKPGDEFGDTLLRHIATNTFLKAATLETSVYRSDQANPKYADEEYGCEIGATIEMPPPPGGWSELTLFVPKMVLGLSEMTVKVNGPNNEAYEAKLEFL